MKFTEVVDEFLKKKSLESSKLLVDGFAGYKISSQNLNYKNYYIQKNDSIYKK